MKINRYVCFTFYVLFTVLLSFAFATTGDADAVFLNITKEYTLNQDGSIEFRYSHKVKLLTYLAVNRYFGETFIVYNPEFQKLTVSKSVTTMADGKKVSSPENAYNEVLPRFVAGAPAYQHLCEMVVTHTGLERGCVIDLEYQITNKPGFVPYLMAEEIFATHSPIEEMNIVIRVPQDTNLAYQLLNGLVQPQVIAEGQLQRYEWIMRDIPILRNEPNHQSSAEFAPRLVFSTCPSWAELCKFVEERSQDKLTLGDKACSWVDKALESIVDGKAKMLELRKIIAEQVGTVGCDPAYLGYRLLAANTTFNNNYGHSWDKALLLTAALCKAGFMAHLAILSRYEQLAVSAPSLQQFDQAWVAVEGFGDDLFFMNPAGEQKMRAEFSYGGYTFLIPEKGEQPLVVPAAHYATCNRQQVSANLSMSQEFKLSGKVQLKTSGYFHPGFDLMEGQEGFVKNKLKMFGKGEVTDITVTELGETKGSFNAKYEATKALEEKEGFLTWSIPTIPGSFDDLHITVALSKRFTPLQLPTPLSESIDLTVELPPNLEIIAMPSAMEIESNVGMLTIKADVNDGKLCVHRELVISQKTISPMDYPDFRAMIVEWQAADTREVIFKEKTIH